MTNAQAALIAAATIVAANLASETKSSTKELALDFIGFLNGMDAIAADGAPLDPDKEPA